MSSDTLYHYIVVVRTLPLGVLAAQVCHAAGESVSETVPVGTHAVVLAARDEAHLREIYQNLITHGVKAHLVEEPDPPWHGAAMAIGITPCPRDAVRKLLSSLPLLR